MDLFEKIKINPKPNPNSSTPTTIITLPELSAHNGITNTTIYISLLGIVYDVTSASDLYGPNGAYCIFAGMDATVGLATFNLSKKRRKMEGGGGVYGLNDKHMKNALKWKEIFDSKYPLVGRLAEPEKDTNTNKDDDSVLNTEENKVTENNYENTNNSLETHTSTHTDAKIHTNTQKDPDFSTNRNTEPDISTNTHAGPNTSPNTHGVLERETNTTTEKQNTKIETSKQTNIQRQNAVKDSSVTIRKNNEKFNMEEENGARVVRSKKMNQVNSNRLQVPTEQTRPKKISKVQVPQKGTQNSKLCLVL